MLALLWSNLMPASYTEVWTTELSVRLGSDEVAMDLQECVNRALMTLFFLVVGLEARRELDLGELRDRGASDWIVQHAQSPEDAERMVDHGRRVFGTEPLFCTQVGPVLGAVAMARLRRHPAAVKLAGGRG